MSKLLKRVLTGFFSLSKSEQKGIVVLGILIVLIVIVNQFLPFFIQHPKLNQAEYLQKIKSFQQKQQKLPDSAYLADIQAKGLLDSAQASKLLKPFPFNPNQLPDSSWLAIGLSEKQLARIKNYEAKGGKFYSKEDFKKIYGISQGEYLVLEPFIEIPKPEKNKKSIAKTKSTFKQKNPIKRAYSPIELNHADSAQIVQKLRLPSWLAVRIIKYRNLLGGFYTVDQLYEVYSMDSLELEKRRHFIEINTSQIRKIDLNNASFKQLVNHPYISYNLSKKIMEFRQDNGKYNSTYDLVEQKIVSDSLYQKLKHYLLEP